MTQRTPAGSAFVGSTFLQFLFHLPVVLLLLWLLGMTFDFVPPVMP